MDPCSTQLDLAWHHFHSQEGITGKLENAKQGTNSSTGGHSTDTDTGRDTEKNLVSTWPALSLSWHTERESLPGKPLQVVLEDLGSHKAHQLHKICCGKWKHKPQGPDRGIHLGRRSCAKQPRQPSPRLHKGAQLSAKPPTLLPASQGLSLSSASPVPSPNPHGSPMGSTPIVRGPSWARPRPPAPVGVAWAGSAPR